MIGRRIGVLVAMLAWSVSVSAQDAAQTDLHNNGTPMDRVAALRAGQAGLARVEMGQSAIRVHGRNRGRARPVYLTLGLTQAVPYRAFMIGGPPRLVVDFREVDFSQADPALLDGVDMVPAVRWGRFRQGWSRMVVELDGPYRLISAQMQQGQTGVGGTAPQKGVQLFIRLAPVAEENFAPRTSDALAALWDTPDPVPSGPPITRQDGSRPLRVTLDPGHGGIDSGSVADGVKESALMLTLAKELSEALAREGVEVTLTRREDVYVALERRMTTARAAGADLFLSLHADALPEGAATGATIYTWNPEANDRAARQLALRHDRSDLLAGMDLQGTDDQVAGVLMDLARLDTGVRADAFSRQLEAEIVEGGIALHKRAIQGAAFAVLKSPDIPSILLEAGFITDAGDRANLADPAWRARMVRAVVRAVLAWARDDAAQARLLRQ